MQLILAQQMCLQSQKFKMWICLKKKKTGVKATEVTESGD